MTERLTVRPAEGRRVRLPGEAQPIPTEGREVAVDLFVRRRLADGDLVAVTDDAAPSRTDKKGRA